ncbi:hypothetical protein E4198_02400 [Streptomyces sp. RKND-216]|uniref:baeRF2 domain-containing protein n=1 Tax=Streptomyces sp. RKND-216 TaxID=2562581 RepID=UPI00109E1ACC|nr:Vms1/Ankzf1 family peptidyl-tRNA hydrolase [Streptomyces sp. RKND-216]THA23729.1 hypothetical protein E4198_02400 [Streptomyces sp. RKND-216]
MKLAFLDPLYDRPGPWASVYVGTDVAAEDAATRQELNARAVSDRLHEQGADAATCRAIHGALDALPRSAAPPGHAVFAADGEVVLRVPLASAPPGGHDVCWSALPHVGPLPELAAGLPAALVARVDRTGAELRLQDSFGGRGDTGRVHGRDWPVHRTASGDWSERKFQNSVENTWEQNASAVAEEVRESYERSGAELVVLAGDRRMVRAVHDALPEHLGERAVEAEHGGREDHDQGSDAEKGQQLLAEETDRARQRHAQQEIARAMDRFRAGRVPDGDGRTSATEGVPTLVEAAREHRIGALLIRPDGAERHREVWVGDAPDQIAVRRADSRYLGDPQPSAARADDALLRSAAATGAEVLCVRSGDLEPDVPDGLPVGGLGALLRWPYGGPPTRQDQAPGAA